MNNSIWKRWNISGLFRLSTLLAAFFFTNCNSDSKINHDPDLSVKMRNLPYHSGLISELRVYKTLDNRFLSDSELSLLTPLKFITLPADVEEFFQTMSTGRVSSQDETYKNPNYKDYSYHIVGLNSERNQYGYLKVRISSNSKLPAVAQVQPLSDTNSFELMTGLPKLLESIDTAAAKKAPEAIPNN